MHRLELDDDPSKEAGQTSHQNDMLALSLISGFQVLACPLLIPHCRLGLP